MICNFQLKFISKHVYKLKTTEKKLKLKKLFLSVINQIIFNSQNFNKDFKPKADVHQQMFINIVF